MAVPAPPNAPAPAQVTYTTSVFTSPELIGAIVTAIAMAAAKSPSFQFLADPTNQQLLTMVVGAILTGIVHYLFPGASGKLGITAPAAWSTPTSQDISVGTNVVTLPASSDARPTTVAALPVGVHRVEITAPAAPPPVLPPPALPPNVTITPLAA
jgi:hypothetical protein